MGEAPEVLKRQLERARDRLDQDLSQLERRVKRETNWRLQFQRRPWVFLGVVFGIALLASLRAAHSRRV